jgi:hypothetical protein
VPSKFEVNVIVLLFSVLPKFEVNVIVLSFSVLPKFEVNVIVPSMQLTTDKYFTFTVTAM